MARESSITLEQVAGIADSLTMAGSRPTARAVRERIGFGSMGTIHRLLQQWKGGQAPATVEASVLPAALQRGIMEFIGQEIATARAPLEMELAETREAADHLAAENERTAALIAELEADKRALMEQIARVEGQRDEMCTQMLQAQKLEDLAEKEAENARKEIALMQMRLESQAATLDEIDNLRDQAAMHQERRHESETRVQVMLVQLAAAQDRATDLAARLDVAEKALRAETQEAKKARDEAAELRGAAKVKPAGAGKAKEAAAKAAV